MRACLGLKRVFDVHSEVKEVLVHIGFVIRYTNEMVAFAVLVQNTYPGTYLVYSYSRRVPLSIEYNTSFVRTREHFPAEEIRFTKSIDTILSSFVHPFYIQVEYCTSGILKEKRYETFCKQE